MPLIDFNNRDAIYLGDTELDRVYVGATKVWEKSSVVPGSMASLIDAFSSQDTAKWDWYGSAAVSSGQLVLPANNAYSSTVLSTDHYDLTDSQLVIEMVSIPNVGNGSTECSVDLTDGSNNALHTIYAGGNLLFRETVAGVNNGTAVTYSATAHRWLRIREAGGTVYWETSPNGVTWTVQRSKTVGIDVTALYASLNSGYWGTEPSPGSAIFDNVNRPPSYTVPPIENTTLTDEPVPAGTAGCYVTLLGAGGGAGSARNASSGNAYGGSGGGGGAKVFRTFIPVADLGSTYSVTQGLKGVAGAAVSSGDGNPGTDGGNSSFVSGSVSLVAGGGKAGLAGTTSAAAGGAKGTTSVSGVTGATVADGTAGGGSGEDGVNNTLGGAAGGGGGSLRVASTYGNSGKGGDTTTGTGGLSNNSTEANCGADQASGDPGPGGAGRRYSSYSGTGDSNRGGKYGGGGGGGFSNQIGGPGGDGYSLVEWVNEAP